MNLLNESLKASSSGVSKNSGESHKVITFGRMNPPTIGHEKVVNKVKQVAQQNNAPHAVILSHSHDPKKNPLTPEQKVKHAKNAFPGTTIEAASKENPTILHHAVKAYEGGATHLHVVAGSDRQEDMHNLLHKYNGQTAAHGHYNFKKITVHSSGERDPDAEGTTGISASKMREHAANGNEKEFHKGAPSKMSTANKKAMYKDVRKGMGISEGIKFSELLSKINEGRGSADKHWSIAQGHKEKASLAVKGSEKYHTHMADHHESMSRYHEELGQSNHADAHAEKAEIHHEKAYEASKGIKEAHKIGDKVVIHSGPRDLHGVVGHIGEIRKPWVGADARYTIDHEGGSVQLKKHQFKKYKAEEVKEGYEGSPADEKQDKAGMKRTGMTEKEWENSPEDKREDEAGEKHIHTKIEHNSDHKLITHGQDFSLKIGKEHHGKINDLKHNETHEFKCMDGNHWGVHKRGDRLHFAPHSLDSGISSNMSFHIHHSDFKNENRNAHNFAALSTYAQMLNHKASMNPDLLSDAERQHLEAMAQMSEETIQESHVEFRVDHRDKITGDVKKTMADHEAKISDTTDKATYFKVPKHKADSFKSAMKGHGARAELAEKLNPSMGAGKYIDDFQKSDAPQFKGKSKEKRRMMGIAAFLKAKREMQEARQFSSYEEAKAAAAPGQKPKLDAGTNKYILVSEETIQEASYKGDGKVETKKYSWGTMKTVHHGSEFSIPLHPEHHEAIAKLKDGQEHHFKDETGKHWGAYRRGKDVHFQSGDLHGGLKTKVKHSTMSEEVEHLDELSPQLKARYNVKAKHDLEDRTREIGHINVGPDADEHAKDPAYKHEIRKINNRYKGIARTEEVEQIDEISSKLATSYKDKATSSMNRAQGAADTHARHYAANGKDSSYASHVKFAAKVEKRKAGIASADKRIKEEAETLEEANHRDMAQHGRMHPDMAKHMHVGNEMDFYGQGTGDKHSGKVLKNDGKEVHIKVTHNPYNPSDRTVHKFKIHKSLDEEIKQTGPVDTNKVNSAGDKPHDEKWEKVKKVKKESRSFADFINTLKEHDYSSSGTYRHKGTYGSSHVDDEDEDEKPAVKPTGEKRGRGRPKGSSSGARQVGSTAAKKKTFADYTGYKLHLPNTNK